MCNRRQLLVHKTAYHGVKRKFQCDDCNAKFDKKWLLERHTKNTNKFVCDLCEINFCNSNSLIGHNYSQHKCIKCENCGQIYPEKILESCATPNWSSGSVGQKESRSQVPDPQPQIPNPKSQILNPKSRFPNPDSQILIPKF